MPASKKLTLLALAIALAGFLATVALFLYRPAAVTGVDGEQLGSSIAGAVGYHASHGTCHHASGDHWRCEILIEPDPGSGGSDVPYIAQSNGWGCWHARPVRRNHSRAIPVHACIDVFDVFFPR